MRRWTSPDDPRWPGITSKIEGCYGLPLLYCHRSTPAERLLRILGNARRQDARMDRFRRLPTSRRLTRGRLSKLFGTTENEAMEDLEDLKLEDMRVLGLRI
jgi:hypothetical protein